MAIKHWLQAGVLTTGAYLGAQNTEAQIPPHPDDIRLPIPIETIEKSTKLELEKLFMHNHRGVRHAAGDELETRISDYDVDELIHLLESNLYSVRQAATKELVHRATQDIHGERRPLSWKDRLEKLCTDSDPELRLRGSRLLRHVHNAEDFIRLNGSIFTKSPDWEDGQKQPLSAILQRLEKCGNTRFNENIFAGKTNVLVDIPEDKTLFWEAFNAITYENGKNLSASHSDVGCVYLQEKEANRHVSFDKALQAELESQLQVASIGLCSEGSLEIEQWQVLSLIATNSSGKETRVFANDGSGNNRDKIHINMESIPDDSIDLKVTIRCSLFATRRLSTDARKPCTLQTTHQQYRYEGFIPYVNNTYLVHLNTYQDPITRGTQHNGSLFNAHILCEDNKQHVLSPVFFPFRGHTVPSKPISIELVIADASKRYIEDFTFSFSDISK